MASVIGAKHIHGNVSHVSIEWDDSLRYGFSGSRVLSLYGQTAILRAIAH